MVNEGLVKQLSPPEICVRLPRDQFQNSVFVWVKSPTNTRGAYELVSRSYFNKEVPFWNDLPAPTVQELLEKLPDVRIEWLWEEGSCIVRIPECEELFGDDKLVNALARAYIYWKKKGGEYN